MAGADISLIYDDCTDDSDEGFEQGDCTNGSPQDDVNLPPLLRVQKYAQSANIFDRQMVSRVVQDLFRIALPDALAKDLPEVMKVLTRVGDESMLRVDLLEQIPHIAAQAVECSVRVSALKNVVSEYLIPLVVRNLGSSETGVDKAAHATLIHLIEHGYITKQQAEIQVCPSILALSKVENLLDVNTGAVTLMSKLAPLLGRDVTERVFLKRFSELCGSHMFYVRKVSASHFGDFCAVVGKDAFETILLPCYMDLCNDDIWGVRKACAEVIMFVSCACPPQTRRAVLAPVFAKLLQDECRWVRMSAFETLGPFISTFADPIVTSFGYNNSGNLVLTNGDGSEFLMTSPLIPESRPTPLQNFFHERDSRFDNLAEIDDNNCDWIWSGGKGGGDQTAQPALEEADSSATNENNHAEASDTQSATVEVKTESDVAEKESSKEEDSEVKDGFIKEVVETVKYAVLSYRQEDVEQGFLGDKNKICQKLEAIPLTSKPVKEHSSIISNNISSQTTNLINAKINDTTATETNNNNINNVEKSEHTETHVEKNKDTTSAISSNEKLVKNDKLNNSVSKAKTDIALALSNLKRCPPKSSVKKSPSKETVKKALLKEDVKEETNATKSPTKDDVKGENSVEKSPKQIPQDDGVEKVITSACNSTEEDDFFFYNSYHYWYISPGDVDLSLFSLADQLPTEAGKEGNDDVEMPAWKEEQVDDEAGDVTSKLEELYSMIKLSDIIDESMDNSRVGDSVNTTTEDINSSTQQRPLNQSESIASQEPEDPPQDIVPQQLIDHFVSMTDIDNETTYHCAYSLPAVALTLGRDNWPLLKRTVDCLAGDMQYKVRRTVASGLHELALILGPEIATENLAPLFDGFLKDLDEVRIGVLKHLAHFLRLISPSKRILYLPRLQEFLQTDNEWNWRFRQELAKQLLLAVTLFKAPDVAKHIATIAQDLMCDKVAAVRQVALQLVTEILRYISSEQGLTPSLLVKLAEKFAHSKNWKRRQTFALLCSELLLAGALPPEQFSSEVLPHLLDLSWDPVANVRLVVARCLSQHIMPNEYFSDPNNDDLHSLETVIRRLQADKDRDVRQSAEV